jgi:hypothetical protein
MCVCIIEFVVVLFKMLSCNALSVVSGTCLFADCWEVVCAFVCAFVGVDNYNHIRKCTEQHTLKKCIYHNGFVHIFILSNSALHLFFFSVECLLLIPL